MFMSAERTTTAVEHEVKPKKYRLRRALGALTIAAAVLDTAYVVPILFQEQKLSETHARIIEVYPSADPDSDTTSYVIGGYGVKNSAPIAKALPQLAQLGNVDAINADNHGIDPSEVADQIEDDVTKSRKKEVVLWGDSEGGLVMNAVGRIIQKSPSLRVRMIVDDCTPTSYSALRPAQRSNIQAAEWATKILPQIMYHPAFQYLYTGATMGHSPVALASGINDGPVVEKLNDPDTPSTALLWSEVSNVLESQLPQDLQSIADNSNAKKKPPFIAAIRPVSPTGDHVVNSDRASLQLEHDMEGTGLTYETFELPGISHGDPTAPWNGPQYRQALAAEIIPALENYEHPEPHLGIAGRLDPQ